MNKIILIGNLTKDPELTETPNGSSVCRFAIAVTRDYKNNEGNRETDFFNITVWGVRGENCGKYLKKGNKVAVVGSLQNRTYEDKDGIKRTATDVVANEVEFLTPKNAQIDDGSDVVTEKIGRKAELEELDDKLPF